MMPLEGYRLLDLSRLQPGPCASHLLADMGMDVIKIEETEPRGGMGRDVLTPVIPTAETEVRYSAYNTYARNKKSIAINLRTEEGRQVFYRLARTADAILEGYRPGVVKRMGVDYETIRQINPRIIYCSMSGYGQTGPYVALPGHDPNYCALVGQIAMNSDDEGNPVSNGIPLADNGSALHAAMGILAAIIARERTGRGQLIDISLAHSVMTWLVAASANYFRDGRLPQRGRPSLTILKCKDGKYLTTANAETHFWQNFCRAIGREDFIPLQRATEENEAAYAKMMEEVRKIMLTKTRDEWFEILGAADTCVAPALELDEVFENPQNLHRGMLLELEHPTEGRVRQMGFPITFSDTPFEFRNFAPVLGQQTEALLREVGYTQEEVTALEQSGAVKAWKELLLAGV